ncbi:S-locus lectin protein kinase family protein [Perilla frutescens var. hirtella]|uniref:Receptor-like serine/threonine-protein kinase n=1 Tax=Perilla frutescens var. hirtella TaxID=608512 RepID=A0AAD4JKX5_PERFH|nr:S-locus lectin protein kinase family protein [Perilla frutescens var. hirtella]
MNTINTTQILRDNGESLISSGGIFELGFFSPNNSENRYVGIWYKKITVKTVVWIANRNNPLTDRSGMLRVIDSGALLLLNATNTTIWSTDSNNNTSSSKQIAFVARLLDSGNLVVTDANDENPENYLWQSFNCPTDTSLPGMKLGKNFVTGLEVHITSPKSEGDLSSGDYTYHCDPTGYPQNVIKKGDVVTYRTGPWNGKGFSGNPNLQKNNIFTYGVVINEREVYYHYDLINDSVITRFTISESGVGHRWIWVDRTQEWNSYLTIPLDNCDIYNGCGPYGTCNIKNSPSCGCLDRFKPKDPQGWERGDWSNGCNRSTPLNCEKGDGFLRYTGIKLPDTRSSRYNKSMSLDECKVVCSKDCSCMAFSSLDISRGNNGCLLWFGDLVDIREISPGQEIYIRMASSELGSRRRKREILIITLSLVISILVICLVLYSKKRKKADHQLPETDRSNLNYVDNHPDESCPNKDIELPLFDLATLMKATDSFSLNNKLGEGGFGPVYKGWLDEGQEIAVKRLSRTSLQGGDEFKNEVICIAKLQHRNLVKLLGCCIQGEEKMLVYEYMTNRSLDLILFDPMKSKLLDWPRRFNIINGIARGLMYLHQDSRLRVIHRDLKASNILLDSNMNPKISDFGLARTFGGDETGANTSRVVGTYGYMSPEYAAEGIFSVKSDVFSFGVIVLEIVSGKRNRGFSHRDHHLNLLGHAWMLYKDERSLELVDPCIINACDLLEAARAIHIGLLCVQELPQDRPTMSSVVLMLGNDGVLPEAKHPGFFTGRDLLRNETSVSSNTSTSTNAMTITLPEGR